jgi:hypothetical protein
VRGKSVIEFYSFTIAESVIESIVFTHKLGQAESFSFAVVESVRETLNFIHTFESGEFVSDLKIQMHGAESINFV